MMHAEESIRLEKLSMKSHRNEFKTYINKII